MDAKYGGFLNQKNLKRMHLKFLKRVLGVKLSTSITLACMVNCVDILYRFRDIYSYRNIARFLLKYEK